MGLKEAGLRGSLRSVSTEVPRIPDSEVDYFERDSLDFYTGDTTEFVIQNDVTFTTDTGDRSLKSEASDFSRVISTPGDGLPQYPAQDDRLVCRVRITENVRDPRFRFNVADIDNHYYAALENDNGLFGLKKREDGSVSTLDEITATFPTDEFFHVVREPIVNDEITIGLYENDGGELGAELASITATDSAFVTNEGIGFAAREASSSDPIYFDDVEILYE